MKTYIMLDVVETEGGLGKLDGGSSSNTKRIKATFPDSPIYSERMTDDGQAKFYQDEVMNNSELAGWMFSKFDTNFTGKYTESPVPNVADNKDISKVLGGPASPYVPNPTSPGAENGVDATKKPAAPAGFGEQAIGNGDPWLTWPGTNGDLSNPSVTSPKIAGLKLGDYIMGRSYSPNE